MKALKFKFVIVLIATFGILSFNVYADKEEFTKTAHKEFSTTSSTTLEINNRFGDIVINDWDKSEVVIDVIIKVESSNKEKAKKKLDAITIAFSQENDLIKAITEIENNGKSILSFGKESYSINIDYTINMPRNLKTIFYNKYGDIIINELSGKTNINLKYGELKANKLLFENTKPLSVISVSYGDIDINKITRTKLFPSYSEVDIEESKSMIISSKYSDLNIGNVKNLVLVMLFSISITGLSLIWR